MLQNLNEAQTQNTWSIQWSARIILTLVSLIITISFANAQCVTSINIGNDTTICSGTTLTISAPSGLNSYLWSTNATTPSINVNSAGTYIVNTTSIATNVVTNGDFSSGNTAFTTDYVLGTGGAYGLLSTEGQYAISTSPSLVHNNFSFCGDHTTGTGNMLIANGSNLPNTNVWCQTVNIVPNTTYQFSAWVTNALNETNVANLQFYVNGSPIGSIFSTPTNGCNWQQYSDTWNSGALTSADICIVNQNVSVGGNDFALDDIVFSPLCTATDTMVVAVETLSQTFTLTNPTCNGLADGEIHVNNANAIEYSFDGGVTWQVDSFAVGLNAGLRTVCSRSALGCQVCQNVTLTNPPSVVVSVSNDTTICENGTANLSASATGGNTFLYHWDFTTNTAANQSVSPLAYTEYEVFAENENGCVSLADTIRVSLFPPINGTISGLSTICAGDNVTINATATGGIGAPYTFAWSNGSTFTGNVAHSISDTPADTTVYTVTLSDGCESTPISLNWQVDVSPLPIPQYSVVDASICEPAVFELTNTTDPAFSDQIQWVVNGNQFFANQETIFTDPLYAGSYDVGMTVTSIYGCVGTAYFPGALTVNPKPIAAFNYSPTNVMMFNTKVLFNNISSGGSTYEWSFEEGDPLTSNEYNPSTTFPDGLTGEYEVILITTTDQGCKDTTVNSVVVYPEVLIYAPNSFTPDGDEHNQGWRVYMEGIDVFDFQLTIFNRWGQIVWESHDISVPWYGTFGSENVDEGTYIWKIRAKDALNDASYEYNGHVNVLR